jgi:chromosome segregation ATPase
MQKAWGEMNKIRRAVQALENEAKKSNPTQKSASNDSSIRDELTEVRKDLDKTTDVANAADRLSRLHASRLSKIVPETLQSRIAAVETRVGNHDQKLREGASELEKIESLATTAKNQADRIGTSFGTLRYKVEQLEERADD